jgi:hypothetical protein
LLRIWASENDLALLKQQTPPRAAGNHQARDEVDALLWRHSGTLAQETAVELVLIQHKLGLGASGKTLC